MKLWQNNVLTCVRCVWRLLETTGSKCRQSKESLVVCQVSIVLMMLCWTQATTGWVTWTKDAERLTWQAAAESERVTVPSCLCVGSSIVHASGLWWCRKTTGSLRKRAQLVNIAADQSSPAENQTAVLWHIGDTSPLWYGRGVSEWIGYRLTRWHPPHVGGNFRGRVFLKAASPNVQHWRKGVRYGNCRRSMFSIYIYCRV